jgi:ATPase subunit of ABC transporter with duplicated ATPase domains
MLMGKDKPDSGNIKVGETVNMIGVGQDRMEELDATKSVFEEITGGQDELELGTSIVNSRAYLSWFGFKGAQQQQIVGNLSGGERNRAQLAKLLKSGANLIILDEPTVSHGVARIRVRCCYTHYWNYPC